LRTTLIRMHRLRRLMASGVFEFSILIFLLGSYLLLATKDIALPGVNFDEAFAATATINLLRNKDTDYVYMTDWSLSGRKLPLMISEYDPALQAYLLLPFFLVSGITVSSLRIAPIFFGLLTLFFTYAFVRKFFNKTAALLTLLLLITSPSFIFSTKTGNFFITYALFFSIAALFFLFRWYTGRGPLNFILGMFFLGLGLSTLITFYVLIVALAILSLIFLRDILSRIQQDRVKAPWVYILWGGLFFCLGNFLYVYANIFNESTRFITFKCIFERFLKTGHGVHNLNYLHNLGIRFKNLWGLLEETAAIRRFVFVERGNIVYPLAFFMSYLWLGFSLLFKRATHFSRQGVAFIFCLIGTGFLASPFALSGLYEYHLIILIPYIQILTATGLIELSQNIKNKIGLYVCRWAAFLVIAALIGFNCRILRQCYIKIRGVGGPSVWSEAIYDLAEQLKEDSPSKIVALTWGFSRNLYFLFKGERYVQDLFSSPDSEFREEKFAGQIKSFLEDKECRYIVNIQWNDLRAFELFKSMADSQGKRLIEEKVFYQRDYKPVYVIYSVR